MLFPFSVNAQSPAPSPAPSSAPTWYNQSFGDFYGKVYDTKNPSDIFGERYTAAQVQWVFWGTLSFFLNLFISPQVTQCLFSSSVDISACLKLIVKAPVPTKIALAANPKQQDQNLWGLVFATDRPFSGIGYVKEKVQNYSLVPTAKAQTVGFGFNTALSPVQDMWRASRDISFGLFVLVAIIFAFMIMFRVKLSPQVVISVQSALPKIITALVLVTFSYAIAGFLVDLMYVFYGLMSIAGKGYLSGNVSTTAVFNFLVQGKVAGAELGVFGLVIFYLIVFPLVLGIVLVLTFGALISILATAFLVIGLVSPIGIFIIVFMAFIILVVVLIAIWHAIKTFWAILKAYANLMLLTIFAPLQIVSGVLVPSLGFGAWLKSFISNLSVFIVTSVLFLFAFIFLLMAMATVGDTQSLGVAISTFLFGSYLTQHVVSSQSWPPLIGSSGALGLLFVGVSFVLFTLIPKATEVIQGLLSGRPFAYGTAIGEAFGPISGPAGTVGKMVGGTAQGTAMNYGVNRSIEQVVAYNKKLQDQGKDQGKLGRFMAGLEKALEGLQKHN
ncbi:MAG: hypothetical protein UU16_C0029G0005 [Candidatus Woesebacteria bacterium GW2011_GWA2_40_7]|uniref:Uncharacterized protein n=1 Tax=Candidatus Woesebacteria bacterium GW2011_GWA2_40_7 TaxID=1618562 RepID=A0A0G0VMP0_9BACT|nr:MAG: hypothetical protein UU16_C0029G0005 [Candidatus Woesebacteria bacterium GW2011_GWA2_40_7]